MENNLIQFFNQIIKKEIDVYNDKNELKSTPTPTTTDIEMMDGIEDIEQAPSATSIFNKEKLIKELSKQFQNFDVNKIDIKSSIDVNIRIFFNLIKKEKEISYENLDNTIHLAYILVDIFEFDGILPINLFEDLYETTKINECLKLFGLLESRAELFSHDPEIIKGRKRNLLLRICIELLKRFSRSSNPDSCGRILLFLAYVFPLSDPSGLNLKGEHNVHPEESLDFQNDIIKNVDTSSASNSISGNDEASTKSIIFKDEQTIDKNFYTQFWSLQIIFQNPQNILFNQNLSNGTNLIISLNKNKWDSFIQSLELVIGSFSTHINLEDLQQSNSLTKKHYFTKYLTSSNLMKLQLKDSTFRRNILTQILITFQNLELMGQKYLNLFDDLQKNIINNLTIKCFKILSNTQPNGEFFSNCLLSILKREKNWILWKRDNQCKIFERPPCQPIVKKKKQIIKKSSKKSELIRNSIGIDGPFDRSKLKIKNAISYKSFMEPLIEEQKKELKEKQRKERVLKRNQERAEKELINKAEYDKKKEEFYSIDSNKDLEFPEYQEIQYDFDEDDLSDLDVPDEPLKENTVYIWKTLRLLSRKRLDTFKFQKFDEIIQDFIEPINNNNSNNTTTTSTTTNNNTPTNIESLKSNSNSNNNSPTSNNSPTQKSQEILSITQSSE